MPLSRLGVFIAIPVSASCALYLGWHESQTRLFIPVLVHELPAYHQIQKSDLKEQKFSSRTLTSATLKKSKQIINRYTLAPVPKEKPLSKDKLGPKVNTDHISDTVVIGIPATPAMVLGGNLQSGDIVDLIATPAATVSEPQLTSVVFPNILVLDVKSTGKNKSPSESPFVVVIALPVDHRQEFATKSVGAKILISRKLEK